MTEGDSIVIYIAIDGYRYDFTKKFSPPNFLEIERAGAVAESLIPTYPPDTFSVHYSLATGMYPDHHGIVANEFYDPQLNKEYHFNRLEDMRDGSWYGGTPFWVAAEKQGVLAASLFWPGSEAEIQKTRPSYFLNYDRTLSSSNRINQIKTWLELPKRIRPRMINLYFSLVNEAAHKYGSTSKEARDAVLEVDSAIRLLMKHGKQLKLPINYVIVSSHGVVDQREGRDEYFGDYIDLTGLKVIGDLKYAIYIEEPLKRKRVYSQLKAKAKHFRVYLREEAPERLHLSNSRSGDIILVADIPYFLGRTREISRNLKRTKSDRAKHSYDPFTSLEMHGIFYAVGPNIRAGVKVSTFENVHVYPLVLELLGIKPLDRIDGNLKVLQDIIEK